MINFNFLCAFESVFKFNKLLDCDILALPRIGWILCKELDSLLHIYAFQKYSLAAQTRLLFKFISNKFESFTQLWIACIYKSMSAYPSWKCAASQIRRASDNYRLTDICWVLRWPNISIRASFAHHSISAFGQSTKNSTKTKAVTERFMCSRVTLILKCASNSKSMSSVQTTTARLITF